MYQLGLMSDNSQDADTNCRRIVTERLACGDCTIDRNDEVGACGRITGGACASQNLSTSRSQDIAKRQNKGQRGGSGSCVRDLAVIFNKFHKILKMI